jgi:Fe-S cluster assembly ATP-binding protein
MSGLTITKLRAGVGGIEILHGVSFEVPAGELHVVMGPNGSGKSTLCHVLMGKEDYTVTGSAVLDGTELLGMGVDARARAGLAEAFQYPTEIPGVSLRDLLAEFPASGEDGFWARVEEKAKALQMTGFLDRSVNEDLSGGEKKRSEIFQLSVLGPKVVVLDEPDSGLDVDAVRDVAAAIQKMRTPGLGVLLITHYNRILRYLTPDRVHILMGGRIVRSGGPELADELEAKGYVSLAEELGLTAPAEEPEDDFLAGL